MKLNPHCIRDILLYVEEHSDYLISAEFTYDTSDNKKLKRYSLNELLYHVQQCEYSKLLFNVHIYDNGNHISIQDLTPDGHKFIENIRQDNIWNKVISITNKLGSRSLDAIIQIASNVMTELIKAELGLL